MNKPVVLCILDGWGLRDSNEGNAPALAHTPHFDALMQNCPNSTLMTYGRDVGLPHGQMGNSEVGHMNIGAGRVVQMDLVRIDTAIEDSQFHETPALLELLDQTQKNGGRAHLFGVISDGGVHGQLTHLIAAAQAITDAGQKVLIHAITDGRDVAPKSVKIYLDTLNARLPKGAQIVTVIGRYYAMDRDNRWERVKKAYDAIALGQGVAAANAEEAIEQAYDAGHSDEFIPATVLEGYQGAQSGDSFFCLNFRSDRARQIMAALADPHFTNFERGDQAFSHVVGMVSYSQKHDEYMATVFGKENIKNTLGAWVAGKGLRQFRVAETEKYPHVTFFLNGGKETPEPLEERYMAPSPKVATYDLAPQMAANEVAQHAAQAILDGYNLVVINFANPDMVGHTGSLDAAQRACEATDHGLGHILEAVRKSNGKMIVTADHGNCEIMIDPATGGAHTAHTLSPVPVILVGSSADITLRTGGRLADLAPTVLELMGLDQPDEMTGKSLLC